MPIRNGPASVDDGALVRIRIGPNRQDRHRRRRLGQPIPTALEILALIDTGAEATCIDRAISNRLGFLPKQYGSTNAPGLGGLAFSAFVEVEFQIPHPTAPLSQYLVIEDLDVVELDIQNLGCEAILGRDVLSYCVLIYDGVAGSYSLGY